MGCGPLCRVYSSSRDHVTYPERAERAFKGRACVIRPFRHASLVVISLPSCMLFTWLASYLLGR